MTTGLSNGATVAPNAADAQADALRAILVAHRAPILSRSLTQIATTFLPFFAVVAAMYALASVSLWLSLLLTVPAAGLVVRIFIIQHDCGHGAFFRSRAANAWLGRLCGLITMTPFANWRRQHALHHAVGIVILWDVLLSEHLHVREGLCHLLAALVCSLVVAEVRLGANEDEADCGAACTRAGACGGCRSCFCRRCARRTRCVCSAAAACENQCCSNRSTDNGDLAHKAPFHVQTHGMSAS